jgi:hypothetical protein
VVWGDFSRAGDSFFFVAGLLWHQAHLELVGEFRSQRSPGLRSTKLSDTSGTCFAFGLRTAKKSGHAGVLVHRYFAEPEDWTAL